jgi:hypothetical protein
VARVAEKQIEDEVAEGLHNLTSVPIDFLNSGFSLERRAVP